MMTGMHSSEGDDSDEKENDEPSDGNKMPGLADMDDNSSLPVKIDSIGCECFDGRYRTGFVLKFPIKTKVCGID